MTYITPAEVDILRETKNASNGVVLVFICAGKLEAHTNAAHNQIELQHAEHIHLIVTGSGSPVRQ